MFYADMTIDVVQDAKNKFLDTFVKEESVKKPMKAFVEAQRIFTKQIAKSAYDAAQACMMYDYKTLAKTK